MWRTHHGGPAVWTTATGRWIPSSSAVSRVSLWCQRAVAVSTLPPLSRQPTYVTSSSGRFAAVMSPSVTARVVAARLSRVTAAALRYTNTSVSRSATCGGTVPLLIIIILALSWPPVCSNSLTTTGITPRVVVTVAHSGLIILTRQAMHRTVCPKRIVSLPHNVIILWRPHAEWSQRCTVVFWMLMILWTLLSHQMQLWIPASHTSHQIITMCADMVALLALGRATDLRFTGHGFECHCVVALDKLPTPVCLCYQACHLVSVKGVIAGCNRRPGGK